MGKGKIHCIEVVFDEEFETEEVKLEIVLDEVEHGDQEEEHPSGTLATILGAPRYHSFCVRRFLQGQKVIVLIDSGATHNFIDEGLVDKLGLKTIFLEGFNVIVANGYTIPCNQRI